MAEMYGSYSDEDLNEWERLPQNIRLLTSSAFGAWLLRRDKRIKEQEPKTDYKAFAEWVADEIFSDAWDLYKDKGAFAEIACKKLAKLGMVEESGDYWVLMESEGEE